MTNSTDAPITLCARGTPGAVPLYQLAVRRSGLRAGSKAVATLMSWSIAESALGRPLGDGGGVTAAVSEYRDWWRMSDRTAWRDLKHFTDVFTEETTPARFAAQARALRVQKAGFQGYAQLPALVLA